MALNETGDFPQARHMLLSSRPLTDEERAAIAAELTNDPAGRGYKGQGGAFKVATELFGLLNDAYTAPNPSPNPGRRITATSAGLLSKLSQANAAKVLNWVNMGLIREDIHTGNYGALIEWASIALPAAGIITPTEAGALVAYLNSTEDDPAWPAHVGVPARAVQIASVVVELGEIVSIVAGLS